MGQLHGKADYLKAATPFLNASERDVNALWEAFNDVAEGFGLSQDEAAEICRALQPTLEIHARADMDALSAALFAALDTDEARGSVTNGLVDALEFLGAVAVMSAMTLAQKLTFVYNCYDFNETGQVSVDELTLALRSTLTGICKLSAGVACPPELALEDLALHAFHKAGKPSPDDFLTLPEFLHFAATTPEMTSWLDYFDCPSGDDDVNADDVNADDWADDDDAGLPSRPRPPAPRHHTDDADPTAEGTRGAVQLARKRDWTLQLDASAPAFAAAADAEPAARPLRPWQAAVANAAPSAPPPIDASLPAASLELDWVYGFNSDLRGVAQYISPAEVVYPAGALVVVYDTVAHRQRFARHHAGLVQALAVHPTSRRVVASGERGAGGAASPSIAVWSVDAPDAAPLSVLRGFHSVGVAHLAWMPNGRTLVSIGQDEFQCVAVYQWALAERPSPSTGSSRSRSSRSSRLSKAADALEAVAWRSPPALVFTDRCGRAPVLACAVQSDHQFVTSGARHLLFWQRESTDRYPPAGDASAVFVRRRGVLGRRGAAIKTTTILSLAALPADPNALLAGTARGHLLVFEGRNCVRVVHAHAAAVSALCAFPGGVLSAGVDGKLRLWSRRLEPGAQFDVDALGSVSPGLRSVASSPDGGAKLLVATAGAELFELSASDGSNLHFGALLSGHFAFELHGLATHPTRAHEFCSVGDDRTVRVWDAAAHRLARMAVLDAPARAVAYSPDGSLLALGYGATLSDGDGDGKDAEGDGKDTEGDAGLLHEASAKRRRQARELRLVNATKQGAFAVLSESSLAVQYEAKDAKKPIATVRFSGDGRTLAVGSSDNCIYAYNTDDWASRGKCKARDAAAVLSSVDFSASGEFLMANARASGEMVFFEASSGVEVTRAAALKDVDWLTCTCPFGWAVQGAWPATDSAQSYDVSAVDRSPGSPSRGDAALLLAAGDTFGTLRLFRYPCVAPNALGLAARGASSALSSVRFNADGSLLLAAARDERCLFQWRVEAEDADELARAPEYEAHATSDDEAEASRGDARSALDEAMALGDYALDLLQQRLAASDEAEAPAAPPPKPWVGSSVPPSAAPPAERLADLSAVPSDGLELEWVHGYRCHDARNNIFLSRARGLLVYPAATVVVLLDTTLWLQRHFKQHTDEVTSLATHFGGRGQAALEVAASGQRGSLPTVYVWRLDSLEVLAALRGFHRHGIAELRFSPSGSLLATVGLDDRNSLAIYDWRNAQLLASASTTAVGRVLGMSFQQEDEEEEEGHEEGQGEGQAEAETVLVTVGVKSVLFWRLPAARASNLAKKEAVLGARGQAQTFLSAVFCGRDAVVGTMSGDLYRFKGAALAAVVPAHARGVAALHCVPRAPHQLASGGKDGVVKLWSADLECLREFGEFNAAGRHPIRSVFWDAGRDALAVGTRGASIFRLSAADGSVQGPPEASGGGPQPLVSGHWRYELHGLSVCERTARFCTAGDDAVLRVWDLVRHAQVLALALETSSRACAYSHDGQSLAVGLGSGAGASKRHKKDGSLLVFDAHAASLELAFETRDAKQAVSAVRFSPDDQALVVGALDHSVYVYDVPANYAKRAVFAKHKAAIAHLDVSCDSQYLRSACAGGELLFADVTTGSHVASASALRDARWASCSAVYNWATQGAWAAATPAAARRLEVTASAASYAGDGGLEGEMEEEEALLVAGTAHGALHLFKYPCCVKGAGCSVYAGHSGAVARVEFAGSGGVGGATHCVSIGRTDRCVLQWRRRRADGGRGARPAEAGAPMVASSSSSSAAAKEALADPAVAAEELFVPEAFVNAPADEAQPYLSALVAPSEPPAEASGAEGVAGLELEHAFGFRGGDARGNAVYSAGKLVVYPTGCLGVSYDRRAHAQRFYRGHARPIASLAASRDGALVATGEICAESFAAERPRVHVWDPATCVRVAALPAVHARAVRALAFSASRRLLASVGQDEHHSLAVFRSPSGRWHDAALAASARSTRRAVLFVAFLDAPEGGSAGFDLVSGGEGHVTFWTLDAPRLAATRGALRAPGVAPGVSSVRDVVALCGAAVGALAVTGAASGHLLAWEAGVLTRVVPAHAGAVYALHATAGGCVSGGRDGHVRVWSRALAPVADVDVAAAAGGSPSPLGGRALEVSSVCWDAAEDRVLVGARSGALLELSRLTGDARAVAESPCAGDVAGAELHGLAAHPLNPALVATAAGDGAVRVWSLETRRVAARAQLDGPLRCVAYSPDGAWLAVGFGGGALEAAEPSAESRAGHKHGALAVLDARTLELAHQARDARQSALDVRFSPDGTLLALAAADRAVYLYSPPDAFALRAKFAKASAAVTRIDFSADGAVLRASSAAGELLFARALDGSQLTAPSALRDTRWGSHACLFQWDAQGVWDRARRPHERVLALARARGLKLLVAATDAGQLRAHALPCLSPGQAPARVLRGHALVVANAAFTCDDARLVSVGAHDRSLLVWRVGLGAASTEKDTKLELFT